MPRAIDHLSSATGLWLAALFIPLIAWSKDAAVVVLVLTTITALAQRESRAAILSPIRFTVAGVLCGGFFLWSFAALAWAPSPSWSNWLKAMAVVLCAAVLFRGTLHAPRTVLDRALRPLIVGMLVLFVLLLAERLTGGFLIGLVRRGDSVERLFDIMSPGLAVLCCLLYPTAYLMWRLTSKRAPSVALVIAVFIMGLSYRMDAAPFAVACGAVSFAIAIIGGRYGFILVAVGVSVVALLWGPVASIAWMHGLQNWFTAHMNYNWGIRVEIWHHVAMLIAGAPWIGHGFDSARLVGQPNVSDVLFLHPHNGFLQVALELGLVGVVLLAWWASAAARSFLRAMPENAVLATVAATVTALAVFWLISFGIWQGWWLSAIGLTFCALALAFRASTPA